MHHRVHTEDRCPGEYEEEYNDATERMDHNKRYFVFTFENGRGHERYTKFKYWETGYGGRVLKDGGFEMPNTRNENFYYDKDDPDW